MSTFRGRRKGRESQAALEFTLFMIMTFLIFAAFLASVSKQMVDINLRRDKKELRDVVNRLRQEIFLASIVRDGYYREFRLPDNINRKSYSLAISSGQLQGNLQDITYPVPIPEVTGSPLIGVNTINRSGGIIYLN